MSVVESYSPAFAASLERIEAPTLILWSRGDRAVPISYARHYLELITDVKLIELPLNAGHGASQYQPAVQAQRICSFWGEEILDTDQRP